MEQALRAASDDHGLKVLIVRAGDFFGPKAGKNSWLGAGLVKPGKPLSAVMYPGPLEVAHSWAYLPDVAEAMVRLAGLPDLGAFETFHLRGHAVTGDELVAALQAVAGRKVSVSRLPWFALKGVAPFNETFREMLEMRYLWETPVLMDNARMVARLGAEPHTPIEDALRTALAGLGCLPRSDQALAA